uniref:FtsX-like permease family protein n=2 Tax=Gemmatimonas sp. TaxID=1962908 RepID=UPI0035686368
SLLVAVWTLRAIGSLMPVEASATINLTLQPPMVIFAAVTAITTGLIFGLFPALHSTRSDLITVIRAGAGQIAGGRSASRFRTVLVTAQIALSMALLISAGLFLKSLVNVSRADLGLSVDNVATFSITPMRSGYDSTRAAVLYERVEQELAAIPGATGVTSSMVPLLSGDNWGENVRVQEFTHGPDNRCECSFQLDRSLLPQDAWHAAAGRARVLPKRSTRQRQRVLVNQAFVKKFNLGMNPIGKFMSEGSDSLDMQIVGLVKDAKYAQVKDDVPPVFDTPWRLRGSVSGLYFYVNSSIPPEQLLKSISAIMKRIDPTVPVEDLKTMPQQIRENVFLDRLISIMTSSFAVLATLLAAVGLYGVLAYSVAQRTREIGVRIALGADAGHVRGLVLRQVSAMTLVGSVIGIAAAFARGRAAQSQL